MQLKILDVTRVLGALTVVAACAGCFEREDTDPLRDLEEGKLAPPGVTLVKEFGDDGPALVDASYQRVYQTPPSGGADIVAFFEAELEKRAWRADPLDSGAWFKREFTITVRGGGIEPESGNRQWVVRVTYDSVNEGTR